MLRHHEASKAAKWKRSVKAKAPPFSPLSKQPSLTSSISRGIFGVFVLSLLAVSVFAGGGIYLASTHGTSDFAAAAAPFIFVDDDDGLGGQGNIAKMNYFGGRRANDVTPWLGRGRYRESSQKSAHLMVDLFLNVDAPPTMSTKSSDLLSSNNVVEFMVEDVGVDGSCWIERR